MATGKQDVARERTPRHETQQDDELGVLRGLLARLEIGYLDTLATVFVDALTAGMRTWSEQVVGDVLQTIEDNTVEGVADRAMARALKGGLDPKLESTIQLAMEHALVHGREHELALSLRDDLEEAKEYYLSPEGYGKDFEGLLDESFSDIMPHIFDEAVERAREQRRIAIETSAHRLPTQAPGSLPGVPGELEHRT